MPGFLTPWPPYQVFDSDGAPLAGALAYFYLTGTATPTPTYADGDLDVENTNPVEADVSGVFPAIYLDPAIQYKVVLNDADDVLVDDRDPVPGVVSQAGDSITYDTTAASTGALTETTLATFTIPANTLVQDGQTVMVRVWGSMLLVSAGERTMKVKLNGTAYSTMVQDSPNNASFMAELQIMRTGSNAQSVGALNVIGTPTWSATTAALTDTNDITVTVTAQNGATAAPTSGSDMTYTASRVWLS